MTAPHLPEHVEFFEHLRAGNLCFPRCRDCNLFHWYPKSACPHCQSAALTWRAVAGRGEVFSFTVVHHAFDEKSKGRLPYIVALVTFADAPGVRLITNIVGVALRRCASALRCNRCFPRLARRNRAYSSSSPTRPLPSSARRQFREMGNAPARPASQRRAGA